MAGYSSDDGDYYSDGGWGEEYYGGYYSDDHSEQQEFSGYDNVSESHEGTGWEDNCEEQDDNEGSHDKGTKSEELSDEQGHQVGGYGVPGNVIVNPGQDGLQQTMPFGVRDHRCVSLFTAIARHHIEILSEVHDDTIIEPKVFSDIPILNMDRELVP